MRKISRAVKRVHVPAELCIHFGAAPFFGNDAMTRKSLAQALDDELLAGPVRRRHQIVIALELKGDTAMSKQHLSCLARDFDRRIHIVGHNFSSTHGRPKAIATARNTRCEPICGLAHWELPL